MPGTNTAQAATVRPFADVLSEVNKGLVADEAATRLAELVAAVRETGKKGTLRLTIEVSPFSGNDDIVKVAGAVELRAPRAEAPASIFYPDEDGNLSRNDPNTLPIFQDRDVPGVRQ
jgi:hypothetical protein